MIHQYKMGGRNIVMDIASGSIHEVDDATYDMIELYGKEDRESVVKTIADRYPDLEEGEAAEIYDELSELAAEGKLFAEDTFAPMAGELKARTSGVVKALCLHVAHSCNLNCSYCFASRWCRRRRAMRTPDIPAGKRLRKELESKNGSIPISIKRGIAPNASFVCNVDNTK